MNGRAMLAGLLLLPMPGAVGWAAERPVLRPVPLNREVTEVQPMTGLVVWDTSPHQPGDPIQLEFSYLGFGRMVTESGEWDFSYFSDHDQKKALAPRGPHGISFEAAARAFGISYMIGDDQPNYQSAERIRKAGLACGYRFRVVSFRSVAGPGGVGGVSEVFVRNEGIAPIYQDAYVTVDGVRAVESLKGLGPGQGATFRVAAGGDAPELRITCERLVPGQEIGFVADLGK